MPGFSLDPQKMMKKTQKQNDQKMIFFCPVFFACQNEKKKRLVKTFVDRKKYTHRPLQKESKATSRPTRHCVYYFIVLNSLCFLLVSAPICIFSSLCTASVSFFVHRVFVLIAHVQFFLREVQ